MSSFEIAVNETAAPKEWIEFTLGGKICQAVAQPTSGQVAYVLLHMNKAKRGDAQAGALLNFLDSLLSDETQEYVLDLLLDTRNDFDAEKLMGILENLMEAWGARPTVLPSDSSGSPNSGGPFSKPITPDSTSSVVRSTASSILPTPTS